MRLIIFTLLLSIGYFGNTSAASATYSTVDTSVKAKSKESLYPTLSHQDQIIPQSLVQKNPKLFLARNCMFTAMQTIGVIFEVAFLAALINEAESNGYDRSAKILIPTVLVTSIGLIWSAAHTLINTIKLYNQNRTYIKSKKS